MRYTQVREGRFLRRLNRFIAVVNVEGHEEIVHVKNTGRCKELLLPDARIFLAHSDNPTRKTQYDLIGVEKIRESKTPLLINMDSQAPNAVVEEWLKTGRLFPPGALIRREVTYGGSRFDFYIENGDQRAFLEVKGVTLEQDGIALFPDAPTERGIKHLRELRVCMQDGYEAYVVFVIQMKEVLVFRPNDTTHAAFGLALREAAQAGVTVLAVDCQVSPDTMIVDAPVPVEL